MSGGSQDYLYIKVEQVIDDIFKNKKDLVISESRSEQVKQLYRFMATFMHKIEWIDSGDIGEEMLEDYLKQFKKDISVILNDIK